MKKTENAPLLHYHENWWKVESASIWYLAGNTTTDTKLKVGAWYFSDETQDFNGPYDSRSQAESAAQAYEGCLK